MLSLLFSYNCVLLCAGLSSVHKTCAFQRESSLRPGGNTAPLRGFPDQVGPSSQNLRQVCCMPDRVTLKPLIWILVNRKKLKMSGLEQEAMMSSLMLDKLDKIKVRLLFIFFFFFFTKCALRPFWINFLFHTGFGRESGELWWIRRDSTYEYFYRLVVASASNINVLSWGHHIRLWEQLRTPESIFKKICTPQPDNDLRSRFSRHEQNYWCLEFSKTGIKKGG